MQILCVILKMWQPFNSWKSAIYGLCLKYK